MLIIQLLLYYIIFAMNNKPYTQYTIKIGIGQTRKKRKAMLLHTNWL